jgi:hypothetical protein
MIQKTQPDSEVGSEMSKVRRNWKEMFFQNTIAIAEKDSPTEKCGQGQGQGEGVNRDLQLN